jgi:hypothetical protein
MPSSNTLIRIETSQARGPIASHIICFPTLEAWRIAILEFDNVIEQTVEHPKDLELLRKINLGFWCLSSGVIDKTPHSKVMAPHSVSSLLRPRQRNNYLS